MWTMLRAKSKIRGKQKKKHRACGGLLTGGAADIQCNANFEAGFNDEGK